MTSKSADATPPTPEAAKALRGVIEDERTERMQRERLLQAAMDHFHGELETTTGAMALLTERLDTIGGTVARSVSDHLADTLATQHNTLLQALEDERSVRRAADERLRVATNTALLVARRDMKKDLLLLERRNAKRVERVEEKVVFLSLKVGVDLAALDARHEEIIGKHHGLVAKVEETRKDVAETKGWIDKNGGKLGLGFGGTGLGIAIASAAPHFLGWLKDAIHWITP